MCCDGMNFKKSCQEIVNYAFRAELEWYSTNTCQTTRRKPSGHLVSTTQVSPQQDKDPLIM